MSGGHYDYAQYRLNDIAREMKTDILKHGGEHPDYEALPDDILEIFKVTHDMLRVLNILVERCDFLMSCDDGPESFRRRLFEDLKESKLSTREMREFRKKIISKLNWQ